MLKIDRSSELSIRYLLDRFPVVAVLGARQVGKSTLIRLLYPTSRHFDLEIEQHYEAIEDDVAFFLKQNPAPLIFDEAQLSNKLFQGLRVAVDNSRDQNGQYLLSGSSSPQLLKNISESLAGRIALYELSGFTINEAFKKPLSNFYSALLEKDIDRLLALPVQVEYSSLIDLCFNGGYPEHFIHRNDPIFHDQWLDNYLRTYIDRDIRALYIFMAKHSLFPYKFRQAFGQNA